MKLKDNKIFRWIAIPICVALVLFGRFIPPFEGLSQDAMGVIFIFLGSLILWLTIGIDWPSLLCIFGLGLLPTIKFSSALSSSFGNSTFIFLLFTFICTYALSKTSFIKRIAIGFVNNKLAKKSGHWFTFLFLLSVLVLGLFISPSVLFVIILPILEEIFKIAKIEKGDKIAKVLLMGLGFTVSISSGMTTIAHVFPVLAMGSLSAIGITVSPFKYMLFAIPVGLVTFGLMLLIFRLFIRPDVSKLQNVDVSSLKNEVPEINKKDIWTLVIFGIVILMWIVPSFFEHSSIEFLKKFYTTMNGWGTAMPPILGTLALCIIRVDNKPLINIVDAFKNGVPWGSLLMCAGTLALSSALTNNNIGIKAFLETSLSGSLNTLPSILLLIIFASWAALQTNVSSNMVTATLVSSVCVTVLGSNPSVNVAVMCCIIGMLASYAFATPPSMPHIAIVAGHEYCDTKNVLGYGSLLMVVSIIVALLVGYPLGCLIL